MPHVAGKPRTRLPQQVKGEEQDQGFNNGGQWHLLPGGVDGQQQAGRNHLLVLCHQRHIEGGNDDRQQEPGDTHQPPKAAGIEVLVVILGRLKVFDEEEREDQRSGGIVHHHGDTTLQKFGTGDIGPLRVPRRAENRVTGVVDKP